jgi:hypothetical protein
MARFQQWSQKDQIDSRKGKIQWGFELIYC